MKFVLLNPYNFLESRNVLYSSTPEKMIGVRFPFGAFRNQRKQNDCIMADDSSGTTAFCFSFANFTWFLCCFVLNLTWKYDGCCVQSFNCLHVAFSCWIWRVLDFIMNFDFDSKTWWIWWFFWVNEHVFKHQFYMNCIKLCNLSIMAMSGMFF